MGQYLQRKSAWCSKSPVQQGRTGFGARSVQCPVPERDNCRRMPLADFFGTLLPGLKYPAILMGLVGLLILDSGLHAAEIEPLKPRVPLMERGLARQMTSPFGPTKTAQTEILAEGKQLYEGKGTCVSCHGVMGTGDGPSGRLLHPSPRDFTNCQFQKHRSDGELFWVLQNGSPGTGMIPMIPVTLSEEEAWKVIAYERSFCQKRRR